MFKSMDKEINTILGSHTILIWTYEIHSKTTFDRKGFLAIRGTVSLNETFILFKLHLETLNISTKEI